MFVNHLVELDILLLMEAQVGTRFFFKQPRSAERGFLPVHGMRLESL